MISSKLVAYFEARFDPDRSISEGAAEEIRQDILQDLRQVASLDQDQILRHMLGTIQATVRTNAYLEDREALSLKLRSAAVPEMPKPFPLFEIFVYSAEMEAIHLRGGVEPDHPEIAQVLRLAFGVLARARLDRQHEATLQAAAVPAV